MLFVITDWALDYIFDRSTIMDEKPAQISAEQLLIKIGLLSMEVDMLKIELNKLRQEKESLT